MNDPVKFQRSSAGDMAYHSGLSAEAQVADDYVRRGYAIVSQRWRGPGGEIDLILRNGNGLVFVEVKKSKSFARAAERISQRQMARICTSAEVFLATEPNGALTDVRFDVALIDQVGAVRVIENAFGHG